MITNKVKMRLQGHEKFALREGWINKGLLIIPEMPDAFLRKDAPDIFGIGNNMVKSLRYWMKALGLSNDNGSELSALGKIVAEYDPYLEDVFTIWLLHSNIAKNCSDATTWYMYFNHCDADDLDKEQIEAILLREVIKYANGQKFSEKSLSNDVDVLLNMYSKKREKTDPEDKSTSPFVQLGLVKNIEGKYIKNHPNRKYFSDQLVLYELSLMLVGRDNISIEDVINGENGLAKVYNLTSVAANDLFDRLDASGDLRVDRTAGLDIIYPINKLIPEQIVREYYKNR